MRRYKTHQNFIDKKDTVSENAKPQKFTEKVKWEEWKPTFINFLRSLPGRHGIPLAYICRDNEAPIVDSGANMLEDYKNRAPLNGEAFGIDAAEVHTYIIKFISGNTVAEARVLQYNELQNGHTDFIALRDHYEGVGINSVDIVKAVKILDSLYYHC